MRNKKVVVLSVGIWCGVLILTAYLVVYCAMTYMKVVDLTFYIAGNNIEVRTVLKTDPFVFTFLCGFLIACLYLLWLWQIAKHLYPIRRVS